MLGISTNQLEEAKDIISILKRDNQKCIDFIREQQKDLDYKDSVIDNQFKAIRKLKKELENTKSSLETNQVISSLRESKKCTKIDLMLELGLDMKGYR